MNKQKFLAGLASVIAKILFLTIRVRMEDKAEFTKSPPPFPTIITFWHNRILAISVAFIRYYPFKKRAGVVVLTSPSKDGDILASLVGSFGMSAVRGSSSRRGSRALMELNEKIKAGMDVAITPDGPRGPKYRLGPGPIFLASLTGARILPAHARFSHCIRLKTWDGFCLPLPFSTLYIKTGSYIEIPRNISEEAFAKAQENLEKILRDEAD